MHEQHMMNCECMQDRLEMAWCLWCCLLLSNQPLSTKTEHNNQSQPFSDPVATGATYNTRIWPPPCTDMRTPSQAKHCLGPWPPYETSASATVQAV